MGDRGQTVVIVGGDEVDDEARIELDIRSAQIVAGRENLDDLVAKDASKHHFALVTFEGAHGVIAALL